MAINTETINTVNTITGTTTTNLTINIASPGDGNIFSGQNIASGVTVSGTARFEKESVVDGTIQDLTSQIDSVEVRLGADLARVPAKQNSSWANWSVTFTSAEILARLNQESKVTIKAKAVEGTLIGESVITITIDKTKPTVTIDSPAPVNLSGPPYKATLKGTATDMQAGVQKVEWRVGSGGSFSITGVTMNGTGWEAKDVPLPPALGPHTITVKATDKVGNFETKDVTVTVIDGTPPDLNITSPLNGATVKLVGGKAPIAGTASDSQTPVTLVEWALDGQTPFTPATPKAANDWSAWSALIPVATFGQYTARVRATDGAGNTKEALVTFEAPETFAPKDPVDVVNSAEYLNDLLKFATLRVKTAASGSPVSLDLLEDAFHQSFGVLTELNNRHIANLPAHQARLCIEVLRKAIDSRGLNPSATAEADYRQTAYEALLRNLGTSYEELRLLGTDDDKRTALANRLGIAPAPDQLDRLILQPPEITEANLQKLFGLAETRDPFSIGAPPVIQEPELLTWRLARLRAIWRQQDDDARSDVGTPAPVIDPDLIDEGDFRTPTPADQAYGLWQDRRQWVADELARIKQLRESNGVAIAGFNAAIADTLGPVDEPDTGFIALAAKQRAGEGIEPQLREKQLTLQAFLHLVRIHDLASRGTVLDAEWAEVYSILTQARKFREYESWREEEGTLTLGPDYFQLRSAQRPPIKLPRWRATPQARHAWQSTLESRIDQKLMIIQALQDAVDGAGQGALPSLREALMEALRQPNENFDAAANRLTRELAIDFQSGGSQKTTRINQAIETLQTILFSVRTGRFAGADAAADWELALGNDYEEADFDEEWKWMGTHGAWQSAMFAFLYPESLLLPTLRKHQTPAFRILVDALRSSRRLSPQQARAVATAYSEYYRDVCSMTPEASCQTETLLSDQEQRTLFYMFGRGKTTGEVYWSVYDPQDTSGYAQTFWEVVPGLDRANRIVGAVPYRISDTERFIYLFLQGQEKGEQKLSFTRYDLRRLVWDTEPAELELPAESGIDTIVAVQTQLETKPPELFLRISRARYIRSLNTEGSDWQTGNSEDSEAAGSDDWGAFKVKEVGYQTGAAPVVKTIHAVLKTAGESSSYWLCVTKTDNKLYVEKWGNVFTGRTTVSNPTFSLVADFIGAFQLSTQDELSLFYGSASGKFYRQIKVNSTGIQKNAIAGLERVTPSYGQGTGDPRHIAYRRTEAGGQAGAYRCRFAFNSSTSVLTEVGTARVAPALPVNSPFEITDQLSETELKNRGEAVEAALVANQSGLRSNLTYLEEAYYFVPVQLALQLQQQGQHTAALDWFQTVYAYNLPADYRKIYYGLVLESAISSQFTRAADWLLKGLNPHDVATERANAYTRFTVMSLARCFSDFADTEFTRETLESTARARTLYLAALDLLNLPEMNDQNSGSGSADPLAPNPAPQALRLRAEVNLFKLRNGLNIAGLERQLEPEFQQSLTINGLPTLSNGGFRTNAGTVSLRPTPYRYAVLIERAKQLCANAQQIEAAFLSALEKRDAEAYTMLKARQDLQLSRAGVRLQDLRVREAEGGIKLAELQSQRAQIQADHFQSLLDEDLINSEKMALLLTIASATLQTAAAIVTPINIDPFNPIGSFLSGVADKLSASASAAGRIADVNQMVASFERRRQEWQLQLTLARQDVRIGGQQIRLAEQHARIVGQERFISETQAEHAEATVDFLANKFTDAELFDWMSGILEGVYAYFLQQATAMAKLAENQLAFERQERLPAFVQADYWDASADGQFGNGTDGPAPDRRGLTGSARLLQDISQLDQHAFETDRRKLQLTKTISLAKEAPIEFQRFRETGVMVFATPMVIFDRDFPGHYLRLIKRVRTSVIALIPPTQGIRATLSTAGASRVVIGDTTFQTAVVNHGPQSVALSAPMNATGLFELDHQPEMLNPFECMGVDTVWELRLPKASNPFDYNTIADALLTVEYTALDSLAYRQQVIQTLNPVISADRPFSFRNQFQDQWYDLHNPGQTGAPMTVRFKTYRADFPPNLKDLEIEHIALYFARADGKTFEVSVDNLSFAGQGDGVTDLGGATSIDAVISTRRGNASNWIPLRNKAPIGEWKLALPNTEEVRNRFDQEEIEDVIFNVTYSARLPEWAP